LIWGHQREELGPIFSVLERILTSLTNNKMLELYHDDIRNLHGYGQYISQDNLITSQGFGEELLMQKSPMMESYHLETDDTPLLDATGATKFCALVRSANWAITLGCFDVQYATQCMSQCNMSPREEHLEAMKRVFGYLKKFPKWKNVIDSSYRDNSKFVMKHYKNWKELYPDALEEMPDNMPEPYGKKVRISCYVDADHAHDTVTWQSVMAILVFINNTPMRWYSK
jgi:hypothetical protein